MAAHSELGKKGEQLAKAFLEKQGYDIVATNWRAHKYEIDLIVRDKDEMVFVEVKTRTSDFFGDPQETVTPKKQKHLVNGADYYIQKNEIDLSARFDVIAIVMDKTEAKINHIENAFYPEVE